MKKILFVGGTFNQTTIVHEISKHLTDFECWFTPYYADGYLEWAAKQGWLEFTVLGQSVRKVSMAYFEEHRLLCDPCGKLNHYDLVVTTNDVILPANIRTKSIVLVQEGLPTQENLISHLVRHLKLPFYLGNTSLTGLSHAYHCFCVASEGFRELYLRKGVPAHKIAVTGIPNFDNVHSFLYNEFPHRDYVLGATSCLRESFRYENRKEFIYKTLDIAGGRQVIFKLHPRENHTRAIAEIRRYAPHALIFTNGNTNHIIANCELMVTKYSTVILTALGLGKPVYSDIPPSEIGMFAPIQNGGISARNISEICRQFL